MDPAVVFAWSPPGGASFFSAKAKSALPVGEWHHVAVVRSAALGTVTFYRDGVALGTVTGLPPTLHASTAPFTIGTNTALELTEPITFDGEIDEVRVWSVARTPGEIAAEMATPVAGPRAGLAGSWRFEGDGADSSGNGLTLTAVNGAGLSGDVPFR